MTRYNIYYTCTIILTTSPGDPGGPLAPGSPANPYDNTAEIVHALTHDTKLHNYYKLTGSPFDPDGPSEPCAPCQQKITHTEYAFVPKPVLHVSLYLNTRPSGCTRQTS